MNQPTLCGWMAAYVRGWTSRRVLLLVALLACGDAAAFKPGALGGHGGLGKECGALGNCGGQPYAFNFYNYAGASFYAFGDSITAGTGIAPASDMYVQRMFAATGYTSETNRGTSGDQAIDMTLKTDAITVTNNMLSTIMIGVNDQRQYAVNADKERVFKDAVRASVVWMAIPDANKIRAQRDSGTLVTYGGVWANTGVGGVAGNLGRTGGAGATATMTLTGDTIWIADLIQLSNASVWTVTIDGVLAGTYHSSGENAPAFGTVNAASYGERCTQFSGLSSGAHTVVLTVSSGSFFYFFWAAGNSWARSNVLLRPGVVVGNVTRQSAAYPYGGSAANTTAYNADVFDVANSARSAGLDVRFADAFSVIDEADVAGDGIHPNNAAHLKLSTLFLSKLVRP